MVTEVELPIPRGGTRKVRALIDSGAQGNFISQHVIAAEGITTALVAPHSYAVDGHPIQVYGLHALETHAADTLGTAGSSSQQFIATDIHDFDAILGHAWLWTVDPDIRWREGAWYYRASDPEVKKVSTAKFVKTIRAGATALMISISPERLASLRAASAQLGESDLTVATKEVKLPLEYQDFEDVFSEADAATFPENTKVKHAIDIEEGQTVPYGPIYPLSASELRVLRDYIATNLARGWIRKSESPAGAPILFIAKKDGGLRLCVDYRALNKITRKNRHPLPLISETLDRLSGAKVFTKLDLRDAYHRIRIEERDRWKTAFRTRYGHFEYTVMPFGLTNAPATFQAYVNEALRGLLDDICVAYIDDILIYSNSLEEHVYHVRLVLERLRQYGLYVKLSKCEFSVKMVEFLGFYVGVDGVSMDPRRVQAIQQWPAPKSYRDIQVFLGFANFYRGFIYRYSAIAAPMTDLLNGMEKGKKKGPFLWTEGAERAFNTLKECFQTAPVLAHYDPERQSQVSTDASGRAIGGILSQRYETQGGRTVWKPVAFFSKKMTKEQTRYTTGDQEMYAIVYAFKIWRHYLESPAKSTIVYSDHETLQSFMSTKQLNRRQARWAEVLAQYDFVVLYRKGKDNPADGLSRRPDHMEGVEDAENPLGDLLRLRLRIEDETHADHMRLENAITVGVTTRSQGRSSDDNALSTLVQQGVLPREGVIASEEQATSTRLALEMLHQRVLGLQAQDRWCQDREWATLPGGKVSKGSFRGQWSIDSAGIVRQAGAVYIPDDPATRAEILRVNHDDPWQGGHFGRRRTLDTIKRFYWWPHMTNDVYNYVDTCDICQRMKVPRHKPYGLLAPLPQPDKPWQDISIDFITSLPPALSRGEVRDAILVTVDRYSKMALFIACRSTIDAEQMGNTLVESVFSKFGVPRSIVSDRGTTFTSQYWGTLCYYLAIRRCFSTAFHPQTDGQTERLNQTLECYLRCYVNYQQDDWPMLLASAEYASNQSVNISTGKTPFEIVFRFIPTMRLNLEREERPTEHKTAKAKAEGLSEVIKDNEQARSEAEAAMSKHYNKKRKDMAFKKGDKVMLSSRHIRTLQASKKLADKFLGPFEVSERIGRNAYKLALPDKYGRLHHTFHVSLLEPYRRRQGYDTPEPQDIDGEEEWEVEQILDDVGLGSKRKFYVRWKGFSEAYDTWEPERNLRHAREAIAEYYSRKRI